MNIDINPIKYIKRRDIPLSPEGRTKCCVYGVIGPTPGDNDCVCGRATERFWDNDAECWDWKPWCEEHAKRVAAEPDDAEYNFKG